MRFKASLRCKFAPVRVVRYYPGTYAWSCFEDVDGMRHGRVAELTIDGLLDDPLVRLLMASDKVDANWLRAFMIAMGRRIRGDEAVSSS